MKNWNDYWKFLVQWEGSVFENDPDDDGNKGDGKTPGNFGTKFGVDAASHPGVNIRDLTEKEASAVYEGEFNRGPFARLPIPLAFVCFDFGMNAGTGRAVKCLQRAVGVPSDGVWGPNSQAAFDRCWLKSPSSVITAVFECRRMYYQTLADNSPRLRKYLKGWLNRVSSLRELISQ